MNDGVILCLICAYDIAIFLYLIVELSPPYKFLINFNLWSILVLAFSPGLFHFQVPGLLDLFSPGTTGPRDLQGL